LHEKPCNTLFCFPFSGFLFEKSYNTYVMPVWREGGKNRHDGQSEGKSASDRVKADKA